MAKMKDKYMGPVKVGPKGQIVIPKEVRDMFDINPGDTLVLLADKKHGIAIERYSFFSKIADSIFEKKNRGLDEELFANGIRVMEDEL